LQWLRFAEEGWMQPLCGHRYDACTGPTEVKGCILSPEQTHHAKDGSSWTRTRALSTRRQCAKSAMLVLRCRSTSITKPGKTPLGLEEAYRALRISPAEFDEVAAKLGRSLDSACRSARRPKSWQLSPPTRTSSPPATSRPSSPANADRDSPDQIRLSRD